MLERYRRAVRATAPRTISEAPEPDAGSDGGELISPDGRYACVVKGYDLWLKDSSTGTERQLTNDGQTHYCYGQQSETGLSAISYRQHPSPMASWSADSQWLLTHRIDERFLPDLALVQHAPPGGGRPILHQFKYAMPGDPLPTAIYVAIHIASGRLVSFDDVSAPVVAAYAPFARTAWFDETNKIWMLRFDRCFKQIDLVCLDPEQGSGRVVLSETASSGYIDVHPIMGLTPNVRILAASREIIWYSERDGWGHLYLHDADTGDLKGRITEGNWFVRDVVHVDERRRKILFLAAALDPRADPAHRSLCSVNLDRSDFQLLLQHDGDIYASGVSTDSRFATVQYRSVDRGNHTEIVDLTTRRGVEIAASLPEPNEVLPRRFIALAADGVTRLHGVMFLPSDFDETHAYPLIDYIYPGPQTLHQPQSFCSISSTQARAFAELGFVTLMIDTRRMPIGNRDVQQDGYGQLLEPQLADHAAVVNQLCERHAFIDRTRIGVLGNSGGGAAAVRALCDYADIYTVAVAVNGNHDCSLYTTVWSDKYRGCDNPSAWISQANGAVASKLRGKLFLIAGDMDENVHVSQTLSLVDALIKANRNFDLLIVPNEGHLALTHSGYVQRRVWDYFVLNLLGEKPPDNFAIHFEPHAIARASKLAWQEFQ
jgi:dipeptidyl-peptidase 4